MQRTDLMLTKLWRSWNELWCWEIKLKSTWVLTFVRFPCNLASWEREEEEEMKKYAKKARPFYRKIFIYATIVNKPYGWSTPKHKFAAYGIARMNLLHDSHGQSAHFQRVTGLNVFLPRLLAADLFGSPAWCLPVNFALQHGAYPVR